MEDIKLTISNVLEYIESVPEEKMIKSQANNTDGTCCFLGHVALMKGKTIRSTMAAFAVDGISDLDAKIIGFVAKQHGISIPYSYRINDSDEVNGYKEKTPKARIIHLLKDMKEAGIE